MDQTARPSPGFKQNPSYRITIQPFEGVVTVRFSSAIIASSKNAKVLEEVGHPAVLYIPLEDIYFDFLRPSQTVTHCPYKGEATHWDVTAVGESRADVMWAYENPYDEMAAIRGHAAFYPEKVEIEVVAQEATDRPVA